MNFLRPVKPTFGGLFDNNNELRCFIWALLNAYRIDIRDCQFEFRLINRGVCNKYLNLGFLIVGLHFKKISLHLGADFGRYGIGSIPYEYALAHGLSIFDARDFSCDPNPF